MDVPENNVAFKGQLNPGSYCLLILNRIKSLKIMI
ncbi:hypothetical protein ACVPOY_04975 [Staphylococcus aureus]